VAVPNASDMVLTFNATPTGGSMYVSVTGERWQMSS
jgi:hypothetical protein